LCLIELLKFWGTDSDVRIRNLHFKDEKEIKKLKAQQLRFLRPLTGVHKEIFIEEIRISNVKQDIEKCRQQGVHVERSNDKHFSATFFVMQYSKFLT
jgi:hypothetical protein